MRMVMMFMLVMVAFMCFVVVLMVVFVVMLMVIFMCFMAIVFQFNNRVCPRDPATFVAFKNEFPAINVELRKLTTQLVGINPQIDESAERHIAGNTGGTFKMQCFHYAFLWVFPCMRLRLPIA